MVTWRFCNLKFFEITKIASCETKLFNTNHLQTKECFWNDTLSDWLKSELSFWLVLQKLLKTNHYQKEMGSKWFWIRYWSFSSKELFFKAFQSESSARILADDSGRRPCSTKVLTKYRKEISQMWIGSRQSKENQSWNRNQNHFWTKV